MSRRSLTMPPQSAAGGCTPRPRKLSVAMNRKVKQKRRPNSAVSGGTELGRISRVTIHHQPSPRNRAASTNSRLTTFIATERARRNTLGESRIAIVSMSAGNELPATDRMTIAKMNVGIESSRSTSRASAISTQPPATAAPKPQIIPIVKESIVMTRERPIDRRAPNIRRLKMSRPKLSSPNQWWMSGSL